LRQWRDDFLGSKRATLAEHTLEKYTVAIDLYVDHVGLYHWPPTRFDVSDFIYTTRERTSKATAFAYWSVLRNWFNYIDAAGGFEEYPNPAVQIKALKLSPIEPKPEPRGLSDKHIKALFDYLDSLPETLINRRDRMMIRFIWRSGARSGEASRLRLDQLYLDEQCARLSAEETKNHKARQLFFGKKIRDEFRNWIEYLKEIGYTGQWIFPSIGHGGNTKPKLHPLAVRSTRGMFERRCSQAGIPAYTVHELRRLMPYANSWGIVVQRW
jgi:integrase